MWSVIVSAAFILGFTAASFVFYPAFPIFSKEIVPSYIIKQSIKLANNHEALCYLDSFNVTTQGGVNVYDYTVTAYAESLNKSFTYTPSCAVDDRVCISQYVDYQRNYITDDRYFKCWYFWDFDTAENIYIKPMSPNKLILICCTLGLFGMIGGVASAVSVILLYFNGRDD